MEWYYYIALIAIGSQILFLVQSYSTYHYALKKYKRKLWYHPKTVLIIPCKGLDSAFRKNISSFFNQDYDNYLLWFVVAEESDPAYAELCKMKEQLSRESMAIEVRIMVAGLSESCSQKIHNLLYCYNQIESDIDVMAFADSDICVHDKWLGNLVHPLRRARYGVTTGYRWFVPEKNNTATLALSAINAKVAQMLGNTPFNQAWGGSMAIRTEVFRRLNIEKLWQNVLSDDLSLSYAVKKAGMKVTFVPACIVASYESITWKNLYEFSRRQYLITRIYALKTWFFGLLSAVFSVLALWGGIVIAGLVLSGFWPASHFKLYQKIIIFSLPVIFFFGQLIRAIVRQKMIWILLEKDRERLKAARIADILFFWLWSIPMMLFVLSSAFGREVCWRSIRYRLTSPTKTEIIKRD